MEEEKLVFYAFAGLVLGIWSFFSGFKLFRKKQLMDNIPTSTVRGLAMGLVELSGVAIRQSAFKGPFTQVDCVAYSYTIERYQKSGKSHHWVTIARGNSFDCPFFIKDDTGEVLVAPQGAEFIVDPDYTFTNSWGNALPSNLINFMEQSGISYRNFFGVSTLRFTEKNIRPLQEVFVLGTARKRNIDSENVDNYKQKLFNRLEELKKSSTLMATVDVNKDGNISDQEWQAAVNKVEQDLLSQELSAQSTNDLGDVVITKGDTEKIFILSDKSQKQIEESFGLKMIACIFGGATLAIVCFAFLLIRFNIIQFSN